ncbi:hypothetical protein JL720_13893 [Aureococcus anophagefferens]|nr:hypothetical protein JL720_13893 [Aureococcus anophagefferens]
MAPNYVRVGVRIRPPFEDEIADELAEEPGGGGWRPAVSVVEAREGQAVVRLELGKRAREFAYDYAFGPEASQADVFDAVAAPVVDAVAAAARTAVFAYGQAGTGKSHTMGILEGPAGAPDRGGPRRPGPDAPPRPAVGRGRARAAPSAAAGAQRRASTARAGDGVVPRPRARARGTPRAAPVLSVVLGAPGAAKKLLFVDLAGSERVRRTSSAGARLREAKSINASLAARRQRRARDRDRAARRRSATSSPRSAATPRPAAAAGARRTRTGAGGAGSGRAAAARAARAPGGPAETALVATVGRPPLAAETQSTLQFASRCARALGPRGAAGGGGAARAPGAAVDYTSARRRGVKADVDSWSFVRARVGNLNSQHDFHRASTVESSARGGAKTSAYAAAAAAPAPAPATVKARSRPPARAAPSGPRDGIASWRTRTPERASRAEAVARGRRRAAERERRHARAAARERRRAVEEREAG